MFYGFDPLYFLFALPGLLIGIWAQVKLSHAYGKYSKVAVESGMTGAQAARRMTVALRRAGPPRQLRYAAFDLRTDHIGIDGNAAIDGADHAADARLIALHRHLGHLGDDAAEAAMERDAAGRAPRVARCVPGRHAVQRRRQGDQIRRAPPFGRAEFRERTRSAADAGGAFSGRKLI